MSDQTPDPIEVLAKELRIRGCVHGITLRPFLDRAEQIAQALAAAGFRVVPVVDDATRQEVPEVLVTFAKWADWYLGDGCRRDHHGYCQSHGLDKDCPVGPMREWLAAYLGRTDG